MEFRPNTSSALDRWIGADTWHTRHPNDMARWYDFVDQYQRDHGYDIDEVAVLEEIEHRAAKALGISTGNLGQLTDVIRERISLAYDILQFLSRTTR